MLTWESYQRPRRRSPVVINRILVIFLSKNVPFYVSSPKYPVVAYVSVFSCQNTTSQNVPKRPLQQLQPAAPRNSNLRELPVAPAHVMEMSGSRCSSTPATPGKPVASTSPPTRPGGGPRSAQGKTEAKVKPVSPAVQPKEEAKAEPEVRAFSLQNL